MQREFAVGNKRNHQALKNRNRNTKLVRLCSVIKKTVKRKSKSFVINKALDYTLDARQASSTFSKCIWAGVQLRKQDIVDVII